MTRIVKVQLYAVVQDKPDYSWSPVMPEVLNTDTIVRVTDEHGLEGIGCVCTFTEYGVDQSVITSLRPLALNLLKDADPTPENFWQAMQWRRPGVTNIAIAALDFALWDLKARQAAQPLYQHLADVNGSKGRASIPAYASVPILDGPDDYIALIETLRRDGFSTFKFHYKSQAKPDIALINAVAAAHGDECQFMFDAENLYSVDDADEVSDVMADHQFLWLEAPFDDHNWSRYHDLKSRSRIPVIAAGNSVVDIAHIAQAIDHNCWDAVRIDAATAGGITPAMKIFQLARDANLNVELQSWGSSIATSANLHLALAHENSSSYEIPVPRSDFTVAGTSAFPLTADGEVLAPLDPGIGLTVDWPLITANAAHYAEYSAP